LQPLPTDLTNETRKLVVPPHEIRPVVPIMNARWPDHGIETTHDGGTCTIVACNSLVAAGALAAAYVLKMNEMVGDGQIPPRRLDPEVLEAVRDNPGEMTSVISVMIDELEYTMLANNNLKVALRQYFDVDAIAVLSIDIKKEKKAWAKFIKSNPEHGAVKATFVSVLSDLFVVLINVLQYGESQYTKPTMLSLEPHKDIMDFVKEAPWILKMPLDHRTTSRTLQAKDKKHGE
jgi:hypothetical protein